MKGDGNQIDYGRRVYDNRLGRFLSVDPLQADYPWWSPYHFAGNSPIENIDLDGLETYNYRLIISEKTGKSELQLVSKEIKGVFGDLFTTQRVTYNGSTYTIHTELSYAPFDGFKMVNSLEGKTEAELEAYFDNKRTDAQIAQEDRQKSEDMYVAMATYGRLNRSLGTKKTENKTSSPEATTSKQTTAANGGTTSNGENKSTNNSSGAVSGNKPQAIAQVSTGNEDFLKFKSTLPNSFKGIDKKHLKAAIGDMKGNPITINGYTYDHLDDITSHMRSLNGRIKELRKMINNNTFSGQTLTEANKLSSSLQKTYDSYAAALQRAANASGNKIKIKKK